MKIQVLSDLHFEIDDSFSLTATDADVLVLAGDIYPANYFTRSKDSPYHQQAKLVTSFIKQCSDAYKHVIYLSGNHEHYRGNINSTTQILVDQFEVFKNVHIMDDGTLSTDGVLFVGGTLWTDVNKGDPIADMHISNCMNDYKLVTMGTNYRRLRPSYTKYLHSETKSFIVDEIKDHDKVVVCTHHAPSHKSIHTMYLNDTYTNYAYYSDLDELILDNQQIKYWIHGHMHHSFNYNIGDTNVICNPKGYYDENKEFNPALVLEI
jgi:Icc-related predicted phosphoesterase